MKVCQNCGAYLDTGEKCDCEEEKEKDAIESLWQILSKKRLLVVRYKSVG